MSKTDSEYASVVLQGAMNPRIHTPAWYQLVKILSPEVVQEAVSQPSTFSTPPVAQIECGAFRISCTGDRWEIQTRKETENEHIFKIACQVFDNLLSHTPVASFTFNFNFTKATQSEDVGSLVARSFEKLPLGLQLDEPTHGEISFKKALRIGLVVATRIASKGEFVTVLHSFHYKPKPNADGFFELKSHEADFQENYEYARSKATSVVESINSSLPK